MPEITSISAIRDKLHEFDRKMNAAIDAAVVLSRVKNDAERIVAELQAMSTLGEEALREVDGIRSNAAEIVSEWALLKAEVVGANKLTEETRARLTREIEGGLRSLEEKAREAEVRLQAASSAALDEQVVKLTELDASTRANANVAKQAKDEAEVRATSLQLLLDTLRQQLAEQSNGRLSEIESSIRTSFEKANAELNASRGAATRHLDEQAALFRTAIKTEIEEHRHSIDKQITDFLNKQNALIGNLTQHIDGYKRSSDDLTRDFKDLGADLDQLTRRLGGVQEQLEQNSEANKQDALRVSQSLSGVLRGLADEGERRSTMHATLHKVVERLEETRRILGEMPLFGKRFR